MRARPASSHLYGGPCSRHVYSDETRVVVYSGGAAMKRPDMTVTGKEIRAFLKDADQDSSLDKAFADGTVKIVSTSEKLKRTRTGTWNTVNIMRTTRK